MELTIQDNFFEDPNLIRKIALAQNYESSVGDRLIWPGYRTDASVLASTYLTHRIWSLTGDASLQITRSTFQYIPERYGEGSFHVDSPDKYTCIIYLTPNPPDNSGTEVCDEMDDPMSQEYWDEFIPIKQSFIKEGINQKEYDRMRKLSAEKINPIVKVNNKFNRMLIFSSHLFHRAQKFFGSSLVDSRLTLVSFIK